MTVSRYGKNGFRITYYHKDGKRRFIKLGAEVPQKRIAQQIDTKIQLLAVAAATDTRPDPEVIKWVHNIGESLRQKLVDHGLVEPVVKMTLGELCERFVENYRDQKKPATVIKYEQVKCNLIDYPQFGSDVLIRKITQHDVEGWRTWLGKSSNRRDKKRSNLDENTVRRRTGIAKQFFTFAIESGWLEKNPFNGFACSVRANPEKQYFVSREEIDLALQWAPNAQWRAIIALSRYGGIRVPSELWRLTWDDVDLIGGTIKIRASKTEHHAGRGIRYLPIFPELRPFIEDLATLANPGVDTPLSDRVVKLARYKTKNPTEANLRTTFLKILENAGVTPWLKLFQNMRATRQTELINFGYPLKDVCEWLGNSTAVAMKHYAMATQAQQAKAISELTGKMPDKGHTRGTHSPALEQNQRAAKKKRPESRNGASEESVGTCVSLSVGASSSENVLVGEEGLEPPTSTL